MSPGYSTREVSEIVGLTPRQIRGYARSGLLSPRRDEADHYLFSFQDIVVLRTARELRDADVSPRKIRRSLERLQEQLPRGRPLTAVSISAAGEQVVVRDRDAVWEPETGQTHFDFDVAELASAVAPLAREAADEHLGEEAPPPDDVDADEWYDLGLDLEAVAPQRASQAYRRAIALDPGHAEAHLNLGRLLHEQGQLREAEVHYRQALAADPESPLAAYNLGVVLEDRGWSFEAARTYERAIGLDPEYAEAHFNLARLHERAGRKEDAVRHLSAYKRLTEETASQ